MANTIKVKFRQSFYDGEVYYTKDSVHDFPADKAIPSRDVEILEGKSTHVKPSAQKVSGSTNMKKDVAAALRNVQAQK